MANDGQIVFEVTADGKHAIADIKEITRAIQKETGKWDDAADESANNINKSFSGMLKNLVAGFSAAKIGQTLLNIGKDAIAAASDLEEVQNVVDVTFGDGASKIEAWSKTAGTQFGLTETQAKRFASTLGAMMKSSGIAGDEIVDMSTSLAGLAADMASFYNLDFDEAFQKIRGGISGETEPLKALGINMSVANMEAFALQQGLEKTWDTMSQGEQTMLRYQYLMQATSDAQGDFSRTSDGYANSLRQMETNITSLKTTLGEVLIPVVSEATSYINEFLKKLMPDEGKRTVLDDFADIDLQTDTKIAQIRATADEARILVDELDGIEQRAGTMQGKISEFAEELDKLKISGDAQNVNAFLEKLYRNIEDVAAIRGESVEETKSWLDGISESAKSLQPDDLTGWTKLAEQIAAGLPGIESYGQAQTKINELSETLNKLTVNGNAEEVKAFIGELYNSVDALTTATGKTPDEIKSWLEGISASAATLESDDVQGWKDLAATIKNGFPGTTKASGNLTKFASDIEKIKFEGSKGEVLNSFLTTLRGNIDAVSSLTGKSAEGAKEWIEGIAASAATLDENDAAGWETLLNTIREGLPGLENTDFGAAFFGALGEGFDSVEQKSSVLEWAVETLGNKTNRTAEEQALWLETCKRLVQTIPGLSSVINTETGEVKGGTQAIKDYIKAWEEGQVKLALLGAHEQKGGILAQAFEDLPGLKLDMIVASHKIKKEFDKVRHLYEQYGLQLGYDSNGKVDRTGYTAATGADRTALDAFADAMDAGLAADYVAASEKYNARAEAYEIAKEAYEEEGEALAEMPGDINAATDATDDWLKTIGKTEEEVQTLIASAKTAMADLADYVQGVREAALEAVNSVANGLNRVDYQSYGSQIEKISELTKKQSQYEVGSEEWKKLQAEIDAVNESLISNNNIYANLESQSAFLDDYYTNLQKAREMGLSDELLAALSDGSVESAEYLDALVNDKTGKTAAEIDKKYQEVQEKKNKLAAELAEQQLTVDQTYEALAAKAKEAVAALDLEGEAATNAGNTVEGIAKGISDHVSSVGEAVDGVIAELNRLNGYGINIDFGGFGEINFTTSTGENAEGSGRFGLDFIPHDDYIARLHEGERVLTAQENQIWNALRNGGVAGFDLETLGGVMRDNVKAGGNVYLDGRVVGSVISDQQGRSYRQLKRSGWQG